MLQKSIKNVQNSTNEQMDFIIKKSVCKVDSVQSSAHLEGVTGHFCLHIQKIETYFKAGEPLISRRIFVSTLFRGYCIILQ